MPNGKLAGLRCVQLGDDNRCLIFGQPDRPTVCLNLQPSLEMCRESTEEALIWLYTLEEATTPDVILRTPQRLPEGVKHS